MAPSAPSYPDHTRLLIIRDAEGIEHPVEDPTDWAVRRAHILAHVQDVMGPLPGGERRVRLDVETLETVEQPGILRKKITYASEPGDRVPAWLLVPLDEPARPRPAVLCLHQTVPIGKDEPVGLGGKPNLRYAHELAARGHVALAPDYPGFGAHRVNPYDLGYASASMKAIWDNMRGVDLLQSLPDVNAEAIGAIGHSLGGHNAIFSAIFDERIGAVVSSCGFNSFRHYYGGNVSGWSHQGYMPRLRSRYRLDLDAIPFDFPELIGCLAPRPFFANAPTGDANFDVEGVRVCLAAARPVYRLFKAGDRFRATHPDAHHDFPEPQRREAYSFLDIALKGPSERPNQSK